MKFGRWPTVAAVLAASIACSDHERSAGPTPTDEISLRVVEAPTELVDVDHALPLIEIEVVDGDGRLVASPTVVRLDLVEGPAEPTGTLAATTVDGRAVFGDLSVTSPGLYRLRARVEGAGFVPIPSFLARLRPGDVIVTGANVLTMTGLVLTDAGVVIEGGRITAVGPSGSLEAPAGALEIDADGGWLVPGLIDSHTHPRPFEQWPADTEDHFFLYLANSVTSIVTMGDFVHQMPLLGRRVTTGEVAGPNVYTGHFARGQADGGFAGTVVDSPARARQLVRDAQDAGYDFVKNYTSLTPDQFDALVSEGQALGVPVLGHLVPSVGWEVGATRGQSMLVHAGSLFRHGSGLGGRQDPALFPAFAQRVRSSGAVLGSTLLAESASARYALNALEGRDPMAWVLAQEGVEYLRPAALAVWTQMMLGRPELANPGDRRAVLAFVGDFIRALVEADVPVLAGSDDIGLPGIVPGFGMIQELEALAEAGIEPETVLRMATATPGEFIERVIRPGDRMGVVDVGARADLALLSGDPRADLRLFSRPLGVLVHGRWYARDRLEAELERLRTPG